VCCLLKSEKERSKLKVDGQQIADADVGDRSAELGQISGSHAVLTLVHLEAQPEPDTIGDVEPV